MYAMQSISTSMSGLARPTIRSVEADLGELDPDRVEAALLPEHDLARGAHEAGRVGLDRGRVVELARDGAALAREEVIAHQRLPRLERVAGEIPDAPRDLAHAVEPQPRLDSVEAVQRQRDLGEVRVSGALAHAVDRPVDPGRARPHGGDRGRRGDAEVVVAVEVDRDAEPLLRPADELRGGLGGRPAEGVDDDRP